MLVLGGPWTVGLAFPLWTLSLGSCPLTSSCGDSRRGAARRAPVYTGHRRPGSSCGDPLLPGAQVEAGPWLRAVNTGDKDGKIDCAEQTN